MIVGAVKRGFSVLYNPKREFEELNKRTFEDIVWDYVVLLLLSAIAAGLAASIYSVARAFYLDLALDIGIQYLRMMNFSLGRSISLLFFYLFAGTFLLFFTSIILRLLLYRIKYASLLKIMFYSLTPILLFGWVLPNPLPFGIWSLFLLAIGVKTHRLEKIRKDSIKKRQ